MQASELNAQRPHHDLLFFLIKLSNHRPVCMYVCQLEHYGYTTFSSCTIKINIMHIIITLLGRVLGKAMLHGGNTTGKLIFYCGPCGIKRMSRASVIDGEFLKLDTMIRYRFLSAADDAESDLFGSSKFETKTALMASSSMCVVCCILEFRNDLHFLIATAICFD